MTKPQAKSTIVEPMITVSKASAKPKAMARDSLLATTDAAKIPKINNPRPKGRGIKGGYFPDTPQAAGNYTQERLKSAKKPAPLPYAPDAPKHQRIIALLQRDTGASITELQSVTNWQAHSVRGFLSVTVRKKLQLPLVAELRTTGERVYHITGGNDA